ncbi:MAG: fibronectin type III domain-containing protein [Bacteroidetes bacterium]|nr:fibronectin type III domain-containing protein [Bacteroidota bacterium]
MKTLLTAACRASLFLLLCLLAAAPRLCSQTVLADFGSTAGGNSFGLAGWNTLIKSPAVSYTADGPGGLVADASVEEYSDYQGVQGSSRMFTTGDRIVATWYNRSQETIRFTARVSFSDADEPDGGSSTGNWYTMRSYDNYRETWTEAQPQQTVRTVFVICDEGVHKTDAAWSLVNVNLAIEWGSSDMKQHLVCDRIELDAADNTPPDAPTGLRTTNVTDSEIMLTWNEPNDDVGVMDYYVFANGNVVCYTRENSCSCVLLEPETEYRLSVVAMDNVGNRSAASSELRVSTLPFQGGAGVVNPAGIEYLGCFRMPEDYYWGGEAVTYRFDGDGGQTGSGANDGFPGSLYVTNVNQPENGLVGEVGIPAPASAKPASIENLPVATVLSSPVNIRPAAINDWEYVDIWRTGLEYLASEQRLYSSWSLHYSVSDEKHATISCCPAPDLSSGPYYGPWYLGVPGQIPLEAHANDYLFSLPDAWASQHTSGRSLVVGRFRDGGLSGLGPTLYAFAPVGVTPPALNAQLNFTTLLQYGPVAGTDNYHYPDALDGYNHSDYWREACWIGAGTQTAVAVIGLKGRGHNWYGYTGEWMPLDWVVADVPMHTFDETDPNGKGWRSNHMQPMIALYDPADLAAVAAGSIESFVPQPVAAVNLDRQIFFGSMCEIFSATFDPVNSLLYVTEFVLETDGALVMHVFRVTAMPVGVHRPSAAAPASLQLTHAPSPVRSVTRFTCALPEDAVVGLRVYDCLGREVAVLADGVRSRGTHTFTLDAHDLQLRSGLYIVALSAGGNVATQRMLIVR